MVKEAPACRRALRALAVLAVVVLLAILPGGTCYYSSSSHHYNGHYHDGSSNGGGGVVVVVNTVHQAPARPDVSALAGQDFVIGAYELLASTPDADLLVPSLRVIRGPTLGGGIPSASADRAGEAALRRFGREVLTANPELLGLPPGTGGLCFQESWADAAGAVIRYGHVAGKGGEVPGSSLLLILDRKGRLEEVASSLHAGDGGGSRDGEEFSLETNSLPVMLPRDADPERERRP